MKSKLKHLKNLLFIILITTLSLSFFSCSGLVQQYCVDCTQAPLVYQGTIQKYTQGVYLETVCITIDLKNAIGSLDDLQIGDIIYIEYIIKQGNFCDPNDKSTYEIYTYSGDKDSPEGEKDYGIIKGDAIGLKYLNDNWQSKTNDQQSTVNNQQSPIDNQQSDSPIIPTLLTLGLIGLAALPVINSPYPTPGNSKTKIGALLFGIPLLARTLLPIFGVELPEATWIRIMDGVQIIGGLLVAYGFRDALWKNANDVNSKNLDKRK